MPAPTFVSITTTAWGSTTTPKTTSNFNVLSNDLLIALAVKEDSTGTLQAPTGGGVTWTERAAVDVASRTEVRGWSGVVGAITSMGVTFSNLGSTLNFGGAVFNFRGAAGVGRAGSANAADALPAVTITTQSDNSAIVAIFGDWEAATTAATWATSAGAFTNNIVFDNTVYSVNGGYHASAGTAGVYTIGVTSPTAPDYSLIAIEVAGTSAPIAPVSANGTASFIFSLQ